MIAIQLLDALRDQHKTDAAVSRKLEISRQAVSAIRGGVPMAEETARRAAVLLGFDAGLVFALLRYDYADTPETRAVWLNVAARLCPAIDENNFVYSSDLINIIAHIGTNKTAPELASIRARMGSYVKHGKDHTDNKAKNPDDEIMHFPTLPKVRIPGHPRVTLSEIVAWCRTVPRPSYDPEDTRSFRYYVRYWNVPRKIDMARTTTDLPAMIISARVTPVDLRQAYLCLADLYGWPALPQELAEAA
jgi:hypothetical protein